DKSNRMYKACKFFLQALYFTNSYCYFYLWL
ncbi:MAG: hypothetical protein AVDCRST_MAG96-3450, partial [uncultured Segetibacter sp.]